MPVSFNHDIPLIVSGWDHSNKAKERAELFPDCYRLMTVHDGQYTHHLGQIAGPDAVLLLAPGNRPHWRPSQGAIESAIVFRLAAVNEGEEHSDKTLWGYDYPALLSTDLAQHIAPRLTAISSLWWWGRLEQMRSRYFNPSFMRYCGDDQKCRGRTAGFVTITPVSTHAC